MEFAFEGETWKVFGVTDSDGDPYVAYYDAERKDRPRSVDGAEVGDFELTNKLAREKFGYTLEGREFLKPGDGIEYYDPIFTAGDPRGLRKTTVLEVRRHHPRLVLENGAFLPTDQSVIRTKRLHWGKLIPHSGTYHHICDFDLRPAKLPPEMYKVLGIEREADRVARIVKEGVKRLKRDHGGEGFFRE
jgi:hypothetical protein